MIEIAFAQEELTRFGCHTLAHDLGHIAYQYYSRNVDLAAEHDSDFCASGYRHGVEGEITAAEYPDFQDQLIAFCAAMRRKNPATDCFHGAGHSLLRFVDAQQASMLCDSLLRGSADSVESCYHGIFSEYTNVFGKIDATGGFIYPGGPPVKVLDTDPFELCVSDFAVQYQKACVFELVVSGFAAPVDPSDIETALDRCVVNDHASDLQSLCLSGIATVSAQHVLSEQDTMPFYGPSLEFPREQREAYLMGVAREFRQFMMGGVEKDWRSFCGSFTELEDRELCTKTAGHIW